MLPAVYIRCLHPVTLVFQHIRHEVAQFFAIAFSVVKQVKAEHTHRMKLVASSVKAGRAKWACILCLDERIYRNMAGVFPVVGDLNRPVPGPSVSGVSSVTGILCSWKRVHLERYPFPPISIKSNLGVF